MKKGFFISIEGTDGSGKSTQIQNIRQYLKDNGYDVVFVREPGGTAVGEKIRDIILDVENDSMTAKTEMLLYAAARAQVVHDVIKPALMQGKIVICDRFVHSSYAYQGFGRGISLDEVMKVNAYAVEECMPDMTIFFDISPDEALKRRLTANDPDRMEGEVPAFFRKVYDGYLHLAKQDPDRIKVIDARKTMQEVKREMIGILLNCLPK